MYCWVRNQSDLDFAVKWIEANPSDTITVLDTECLNSAPGAVSSSLDDCLFMLFGWSYFWGHIASQMEYHFSLKVETAEVTVYNGKFYCFINPIFWEWLEKPQYRNFVLVHEAGHIFFEHVPQAEQAGLSSESAQLYFMACDYFLHWNLDRVVKETPNSHLFDFIPKEIFPICFHPKYDGWNEIDIYLDLKPDQEEDQDKDKSNDDSESGEHSEESDEQGSGSDDSNEPAGDDSDGGSGDGGDDDSDTSDSSGGSGSDSEASQQGSGSGQGTPDKHGNKSLDGKPRQAQTMDGANEAAIHALVQAAVTAVEQFGGNQIGNAEGDMIRRIVDLTTPKIDWKDYVWDKMEKTRDQMLTYSIISRRTTDDVIYPSKTGEKIRVFFGVDSSGSMSNEDLTEGMQCVYDFITQIDNWQLDVATCDTRAYMVAQYNSDDFAMTPPDVTKIDLKGGGGTDMAPLVELAQEETDNFDSEPYNIIVIFTDGYIPTQRLKDVYNGDIPLLIITTSKGADLSNTGFDCVKLT